MILLTVLGNVLCINSLFIYHTLYDVYCIMYDIHYTTLLQRIMYICIMYNVYYIMGIPEKPCHSSIYFV